MQSVIEIDGKDYLVGLNWQVVSRAGAAQKKDLKEKKKETGQAFAFLINGADVSAVGLSHKKNSCISAAALFAQANQESLSKASFADANIKKNWLIVEKLSSGKFWLCAVADGVPVPGTDVVDDFNVISAKIADLLDILDSTEIFSTNSQIQEYVAEVSPAKNRRFEDIISEIPAAKLKSIKMLKIGSVPAPIFWGLAIMVLGVGGYHAYDWYHGDKVQRDKLKKQKIEEMNRQSAAAQADSQKSREAQEINRQKIEQALKGVADSLMQNPLEVAMEWEKRIGDLPITQGGWSMNAVGCTVQDCTVQVMRTPLGNNAFLLERFPMAVIEGDTASYGPITMNVSSRQTALTGLPLPGEIISGLVSESQIVNSMPGQNLKIKVGTAADMTYVPVAPPPPTKPGEPPGELRDLPPAVLGIARGEITVSGTGLWQLRDIGKTLSRPGVGIEKLAVLVPQDLSSGVTWTLTGYYYVATGEGPSLERGIGKREGVATSTALAVPEKKEVNVETN